MKLKFWSIEHEGVEYDLHSLMEKTGYSKAGTRDRIVRYVNGDITKEELFQSRDDSEPFIILSDGTKWTCSEIQKHTGFSRKFVLGRLLKIKRGKMKEDRLFADKYCGGTSSKHNKKVTNFREDAGIRRNRDILHMSPEAFAMQEKYCALYDTPAYKGMA